MARVALEARRLCRGIGVRLASGTPTPMNHNTNAEGIHLLEHAFRVQGPLGRAKILPGFRGRGYLKGARPADGSAGPDRAGRPILHREGVASAPRCGRDYILEIS